MPHYVSIILCHQSWNEGPDSGRLKMKDPCGFPRCILHQKLFSVSQLIDFLKELSFSHVPEHFINFMKYGYRNATVAFRVEGFQENHKRYD